jgi:hypothetical protein
MDPEKGSAEERAGRTPSLMDQEPFATILAHPRRFAWGLPPVFIVPILAGLLIADWSLRAAIALQLALQTAGLLWLYLPPARRRWRSGEASPGRDFDRPDRHVS